MEAEERHRLMTYALLSYMAQEYGVVTQARSGTLPEPDPLGGVRPDVVARREDGTVIIGQAKAGPVQAPQWEEWLTRLQGSLTSGYHLVLAVSPGEGRNAWTAARHAGLPDAAVDVVELAVRDYADEAIAVVDPPP